MTQKVCKAQTKTKTVSQTGSREALSLTVGTVIAAALLKLLKKCAILHIIRVEPYGLLRMLHCNNSVAHSVIGESEKIMPAPISFSGGNALKSV